MRAEPSYCGSAHNRQEVAYVTAGRLIQQYENYCGTKGVVFNRVSSVRPFDSTTLFATAGMQQFKPLFSDPDHVGTIANTQSCLRLGDLEEIGDGTHSLHFEMLGLFSFRQMSVGDAIDFWLEFLDRIGAWPDHVTIHPDRMDEWTPLYRGRVPVLPDPECVWSDGEISGYCTEFYRNVPGLGSVEIGNVVCPLGTCIDVGFGLERLDLVINGTQPDSAETILKTAISKIIESGYAPGNRQQGYVLRKLLRQLWKTGGSIDHQFFRDELDRQERLKRLYERVRTQHADKSPEWWFDTLGVAIEDFEVP